MVWGEYDYAYSAYAIPRFFYFVYDRGITTHLTADDSYGHFVPVVMNNSGQIVWFGMDDSVEPPAADVFLASPSALAPGWGAASIAEVDFHSGSEY